MEKLIVTLFDDVKYHELDTAFMWILQYRKNKYSGVVGYRSPAANIQGSVKENKLSVSLIVERLKQKTEGGE